MPVKLLRSRLLFVHTEVLTEKYNSMPVPLNICAVVNVFWLEGYIFQERQLGYVTQLKNEMLSRPFIYFKVLISASMSLTTTV